MTYNFLCYHRPLAPPQPKPPPQNPPPELQPNHHQKPPPDHQPPPHHRPPCGRLRAALTFPVENAQSIPPNITPETTIPIPVATQVPMVNQSTIPPRITPTIMPGHQAFEGSKSTDQRKRLHQKSQIIKRNTISKGFFGSSGNCMISPANAGLITSIAALIQSKYAFRAKAGTI